MQVFGAAIHIILCTRYRLPKEYNWKKRTKMNVHIFARHSILTVPVMLPFQIPESLHGLNHIFMSGK